MQAHNPLVCQAFSKDFLSAMKVSNLVTLRPKTLEDSENIQLDQHFILRGN